MASAVIHLAVGKVVGNILGKNSKEYQLGLIAPDISKLVGKSRTISHFETGLDEIPDISNFINKYNDFLDRDFELGYLIHLYTDKFWMENFINTVKYDTKIKLLDGTFLHTTKKTIMDLIYNDYTNLNTLLIDDYELDLSLFYLEFLYPDTVIEEIPKDFKVLIDKMGIIIENSKLKKAYIFDIDIINNFINDASIYILKELRENNLT